jgi:hypothetical protein
VKRERKEPRNPSTLPAEESFEEEKNITQRILFKFHFLKRTTNDDDDDERFLVVNTLLLVGYTGTIYCYHDENNIWVCPINKIVMG